MSKTRFIFAKKPSSYSTIKEVAIKLNCKPRTIGKGIEYGMIKAELSKPPAQGRPMYIMKNTDIPTIKKTIPAIRKKIYSELSAIGAKKVPMKTEKSIDKVAIKKVIDYLAKMIA